MLQVPNPVNHRRARSNSSSPTPNSRSSSGSRRAGIPRARDVRLVGGERGRGPHVHEAVVIRADLRIPVTEGAVQSGCGLERDLEPNARLHELRDGLRAREGLRRGSAAAQLGADTRVARPQRRHLLDRNSLQEHVRRGGAIAPGAHIRSARLAQLDRAHARGAQQGLQHIGPIAGSDDDPELGSVPAHQLRERRKPARRHQEPPDDRCPRARPPPPVRRPRLLERQIPRGELRGIIEQPRQRGRVAHHHFDSRARSVPPVRSRPSSAAMSSTERVKSYSCPFSSIRSR